MGDPKKRRAPFTDRKGLFSEKVEMSLHDIHKDQTGIGSGSRPNESFLQTPFFQGIEKAFS